MTEHLRWEGEHFYRGDEPFIPKIFDTLTPDEAVPEGFNAVKIALDGRIDGDLNWESAKKSAQEHIEKGRLLFWEMQMGLFGDLPHPLTFETQMRALRLSLETFHKDIWTQFGENSLGLCIYRGSSDFTLGFPWLNVTKGDDHHDNLRLWLKDVFGEESKFTEETGIACTDFSELNYRILLQNSQGKHLLNLFCRNVCCDYLDLLTENFASDIPLFVLLDAMITRRLSDLAQLLSRECFTHYHLIVKGGALPVQGLVWDDIRASVGYLSRRPLELKEEELATTAFCLPPIEYCRPSQYAGMEEALTELNKRLIHYRIIPEPFLISEWHGLDQIIVLSHALSDEGKRMLQGFIAAGGTVVTIGEELGLSDEISFPKWTEKLLEIL